METKNGALWLNIAIATALGLFFMWVFRILPLAAGWFADGVGSALVWPERPALEARRIVGMMWDRVMDRATLEERATALERENVFLRTELIAARGSAVESQTTGGMLADRARVISARVTLRYPEAWWTEIRIDRGTADGIRVGAPALSGGFMIGRVSRASADYAWIELVTSASFMLAAAVDDTWDLGVINGDDMGNIWMLYIPPEKPVSRDMMISTALVGDYLPPGLPIGRIWGVGEPRDGYTPLKVASGAHLTQLYAVQVLDIGAEADSEGSQR